LAFTCEEAWQARGHTSSIHLEDFIPAKKEYQSTDLQKKWDMIKNVRKVITGALEKKRAEKIIGSSLEAHIKVYVSDEIKKIIAKIHLDEIAITSSYELLSDEGADSGFVMDEIEGVRVEVEKVVGDKCNRCWKFTEALNNNQICNRCEKAIQQ
jgi:isoleucyl-tRNA synthetase